METRTVVAPSIVRQAIALVVSLGICFLAAGLGALATTPNIEGWYATIEKPTWNPPNWIFGPVWTTLYAMMAVAAWLVWKSQFAAESAEGLAEQGGRLESNSSVKLPGLQRAADVRRALGLFAVQLILNLTWSLIFFGLQKPGWALIEIAILWLAIVATALAFWRCSRVASGLLVPYLAWVSFAAVLNGTIWWLNRA